MTGVHKQKTRHAGEGAPLPDLQHTGLPLIGVGYGSQLPVKLEPVVQDKYKRLSPVSPSHHFR